MLDTLTKPEYPAFGQIDHSLTDPMQISDKEIQNRKELLGLTKEDEQNIAAQRLVMIDYVDEIINEYYDQLLLSQEVRQLIDDAETQQRVCDAMRGYVFDLFEGCYDNEYVNKRLRIGKVHHRIGVTPKLYISAVVLLQKLLTETMLTNIPEKSNAEDFRSALTKIFMFDMQLVFDSYVESLLAEEYSALMELTEYSEKLEKTVAGKAEKLRELSTRDGLTGLYNMRGFSENLRRELSLAERIGEPLTLIYIDLNGLDKLNGAKGREVGDRVLSLVGSAILLSIRDVDYACRYGSDEFCIILPRTSIEIALVVYNRVVETFDKEETSGVTFSAGLSQTGPDNFVHMTELLNDSIAWMNKAKAQSKNNLGHYIQPQVQQADQKPSN